MTTAGPRYHAHFDCFSGAAGDMMLAACLDAADSLPYALLLGDDGPATSNSARLLSRVASDLEEGLPDLRGEFGLSSRRVWRSAGRIAARKVDVSSSHGHAPAPVPGAPKGRRRAASHDRGHGHSHEHSHGHSHQHSHDHDGPGTKDKPKDDPSEAASRGHSHAHSHAHSHGHHHDHHPHGGGGRLRNLPEIASMLRSAPPKHIPPRVSDLAVGAFTALARAEAATHGASSVDDVHFHEVGAVDSIVDTVGTLLALHHLGVDLGGGTGCLPAVSCSSLPLGSGTVWTAHGLLPVPAPATLRLMVGMPVCPGPGDGETGELVTPTAAALLRTLSGVDDGGDGDAGYWTPRRPCGRPPSFVPRAVGTGAGSKDFEKHANVMRLILGDRAQESRRGALPEEARVENLAAERMELQSRAMSGGQGRQTNRKIEEAEGRGRQTEVAEGGETETAPEEPVAPAGSTGAQETGSAADGESCGTDTESESAVSMPQDTNSAAREVEDAAEDDDDGEEEDEGETDAVAEPPSKFDTSLEQLQQLNFSLPSC